MCHGTISVQKTKTMVFRGRDPVRTKIVIDNKIIEQVNSFNYLRNMISYEKELDIDNKLHNYLKITGILTLRRLMSYIYIYMEHPFLMFLDHTQRRSTVGRTPLDE